MSESMTYIARAACGCLKMAAIDNPDRRQAVAKEIAKAIRLGETVERVTTSSVREMAWYCEAHRPQKEAIP